VSGSPLSEIAVGKLTGAFKEFFVSDNMQVDVLYIVSLYAMPQKGQRAKYRILMLHT